MRLFEIRPPAANETTRWRVPKRQQKSRRDEMALLLRYLMITYEAVARWHIVRTVGGTAGFAALSLRCFASKSGDNLLFRDVNMWYLLPFKTAKPSCR